MANASYPTFEVNFPALVVLVELTDGVVKYHDAIQRLVALGWNQSDAADLLDAWNEACEASQPHLPEAPGRG